MGGRAEEVSGLDRLANELRLLPRAPVCARLVLPARERAPDLEERYATLWRGLVFLALCLLGSRLMGEITLLPAFIERFIDEGLVIAGWVAPRTVARCLRGV